MHFNGIHTYPLDWTAGWNGLVTNAMVSIVYQSMAWRRPGISAKGYGWFSLQSGQRHTITGGEHHTQLRCLRHRTGAARPHAPHRLRQDAAPHRRPGLLPPPRHQDGRGRRHYYRDQARRRDRYRRHQTEWLTECGSCRALSPSRKRRSQRKLSQRSISAINLSRPYTPRTCIRSIRLRHRFFI